MPLKIVFWRPQNWSRLKPYYYSTSTAIKVIVSAHIVCKCIFVPRKILHVVGMSQDGSREHFLRVAPLQNEVGTKDLFRGTNFLTKNALKLSLKFLSLYFVGPKLSGPNRAMQPRCAMRFEPHIPKSLAMRKSFFASDAKAHLLDLKSQENARKNACEKILRCWPAMRKSGCF